MASTITLDAGADGRYVQGSRYIRNGTGNLGTYATNGVSITASQFEFPGQILHLHVNPAAGYVFEFDKTNLKIKAYDNKDPGNVGGADIPFPEVGNGVDLSSITFRFRAEGR